MGWAQHLLVAPILLPMATGAVLLLIDERRHTAKALINMVSTLLLLFVALSLARVADAVPLEAVCGVHSS